MHTRIVSLFLFISLSILFSSWDFHKHNKSQLQLNAERWADSVMATLSPDERIGQLYMIAAYSNKDEKHVKEVEQLVKEYNIGGVIFFQGGPGRQVSITNRLQSVAKVPLFVSIDGEWGLGMRLDSTISFPRQMTLGAIKDDRIIYEMGNEIARQCSRIGIHINFAPVVDINNNPANPVIGMRSFGENKERVAEKGIAYMKGMQDKHVMANAKHFPGHGDTDTDSHHALPIIKHTKQRIESLELYPFERLIKDSLGSVMVAHMHIPALDNTPKLPTTLSHYVITDMLKKKMGFKGLIFTDAMNMKGMSDNFKAGDADVRALMAGNDVLLFPGSIKIGLDMIKKAIEDKKLSQNELDQRVKKILVAKYWAGLHEKNILSKTNLHAELNSSAAYALRHKLFEKAMTVVKNDDKLIPIAHIDTNSFASISIGENAGNTFQKTLDRYAKFTHFAFKGGDITTAKLEYAFSKIKDNKVIVIGVQCMNNSSSKRFGISAEVENFIKKINAEHPNVIVAALGNPYGLQYLSSAKHLICSYEYNLTTSELAPQLIFGAIGSDATLPVSVGTDLKEGMGISVKSLNRVGFTYPENKGLNGETLGKIDSIAHQAIRDKATPGCQVIVLRNGSVVYEKAFGHLTYDTLYPVNENTIYDVASVTKVAATTQALMFLTQHKTIELNERMATYLPELEVTDKRFMTLREVLTHQAGLFPYVSFWKNTMNTEENKLDTLFYCFMEGNQKFCRRVAPSIYALNEIEDSVYNWSINYKMLSLDKNTGGYPYRYSDMGYYMLKRLIEKQTSQEMQDFLTQNFYRPLGAHFLSYNPLDRFDTLQIAPTEDDKDFRNTLVHGVVHDQGAALIGGVAGHAGIFSNAFHLSVLFQMNLNNGVYGGVKYLEGDVIKEFITPQFENNRRGLGWDKPEKSGDGPTSDYASLNSFGHSGFTGTCVWVDPEYNLVYVFLSNRIYPSVSNTTLIKTNVRTKIHDVIYEAMLNYGQNNLVN